MLHDARSRRSNHLGYLVFCFMLSGCFSMGRDFGSAPVRQIQNNVTTQREVFAYFGEPIRKGLENGLETWTYSYQYYELGQLRDSKELHVVFNQDLTVKSYSFTAR
jgi:SmpA / OmlA family